MPHTDHYQAHEYHGSIIAKDVDKDLQNGLANRRRNRIGEILNAKEEGKQNEESEERGEAHG